MDCWFTERLAHCRSEFRYLSDIKDQRSITVNGFVYAFSLFRLRPLIRFFGFILDCLLETLKSSKLKVQIASAEQLFLSDDMRAARLRNPHCRLIRYHSIGLIICISNVCMHWKVVWDSPRKSLVNFFKDCLWEVQEKISPYRQVIFNVSGVRAKNSINLAAISLFLFCLI